MSEVGKDSGFPILSFISRLINPLSLGIIGMSLCLLITVVVIVSELPSVNRSTCGTDDSIYLAIVENIDDWQKTITESISQYVVPINGIPFEVSGEQYAVRVDNPYDFDFLYVSIHSGWPNNLWGSRGYVYLLDDSALSWWEQNYTVQHLSGQIYCYSK